jgi:hypothetical protein
MKRTQSILKKPDRTEEKNKPQESSEKQKSSEKQESSEKKPSERLKKELASNPFDSPAAKSQEESRVYTGPKTTERFLVLDTESFKVPTEFSSQTLIPLQIAWAIFEWNASTETLVLLVRNVAYVSEVMCASHFRDAIRAVSERCFLRHEAKIKETKYPMMSGLHILNMIAFDLFTHNVKTITAYNISWDFEAIGNILRVFYPSDNIADEELGFDRRTDNPFNPMRIDYLDLMHEVIKKFGNRLVEAGLKDGSVSMSERGKVMLRKNERYSKSVYSAEYTLYHLFGIVQKHLAEEDVDHEAKLLEAILKEFGSDALERNVMYPQEGSYEKMVKIAIRMIDTVEDDVKEAKDQDSESASTEEIKKAASILERMDTPFPVQRNRIQNPLDQCLFPLDSHELL